MSEKLAEAIKKIQPATQELSRGDTEALFSLVFVRHNHMRAAGIRLGGNCILHNVSGQGEQSRWGAIIVFPLTIIWEASEFSDLKVVFRPKLSSKECWDLEGKWVFDKLASVLSEVEPIKEGSLKQAVISFASEGDTFYCLESEVSSRIVTASVI